MRDNLFTFGELKNFDLINISRIKMQVFSRTNICVKLFSGRKYAWTIHFPYM